MQEKVELITNHIEHFWTILDKNTQKRILCDFAARKFGAHARLQLMLWFRGNSILGSTLVIPLTTTTLLDASRTWTTGWEYRGSILTAVCCFEVVAPPISKGILTPVLSISLKVS